MGCLKPPVNESLPLIVSHPSRTLVLPLNSKMKDGGLEGNRTTTVTD